VPSTASSGTAATSRCSRCLSHLTGRSWGLTGHLTDWSEWVAVTTVIGRWNGEIVPEIMIRPDVLEHT
jgi:hypothetical protein